MLSSLAEGRQEKEGSTNVPKKKIVEMFTCLHAHNHSMCRTWPGGREALGVHGRKGIRYHEPDADEENFRTGGKM